ncbi:MAG: nuclear transport factor 2 family protein [Caldilineaceae bacterium]|nr:nuclear transport factor 2 family protein [Caldilineaceae bacterium]
MMMTELQVVEHPLVAYALDYIQALEEGATGDRLAAFFTPDVVQEEFPNVLNPTGAQRDLAALLAGAEHGRQMMASQSYKVLNILVGDSTVVLEIHWCGTLAGDHESDAAGAQMEARFAVFLDYQNGRIARQRNYDCFVALSGATD